MPSFYKPVSLRFVCSHMPQSDSFLNRKSLLLNVKKKHRTIFNLHVSIDEINEIQFNIIFLIMPGTSK
jgi:hypothetical protein